VLKPLDNPSVKAAPMKKQTKQKPQTQNIMAYSGIKCRIIVAYVRIRLRPISFTQIFLMLVEAFKV